MECHYCEEVFKDKGRRGYHLKGHKDTDKDFIKSFDIDKINYIYVHIPKCAGTYIRSKLKKIRDCVIISRPAELDAMENKRVINLGHTCFTDYKFNNMLICFVRNPYDRVISMFHYHRLHKRYSSLDDFIKKIYHNKKIYQYIKDFNSVDKHSRFNLLKTPKGCSVAYSWKNQSAWIPKDIFFIGKVETLEEDLEKLCKKLNWNYYKEAKIVNSTNYNYSEIKNLATKEMIYDLYQEDFKRYGYTR